MLRCLSAKLLILWLVAASAAPHAQSAAATVSHKQCPYNEHTIRGRKRLIGCLVRVRHAPNGPQYVLAFVPCESGDDYWAPVAPDYSGTFQQKTSAWRDRLYSFERFAHMPVHYVSPADTRMNTAVSIHMAKEAGTWKRDWPGTAGRRC